MTPAGCDERAPNLKIGTSKADGEKGRIAGAAFHAAFSACEVNTDGGAKSRGERGTQGTHKHPKYVPDKKFQRATGTNEVHRPS